MILRHDVQKPELSIRIDYASFCDKHDPKYQLLNKTKFTYLEGVFCVFQHSSQKEFSLYDDCKVWWLDLWPYYFQASFGIL